MLSSLQYVFEDVRGGDSSRSLGGLQPMWAGVRWFSVPGRAIVLAGVLAVCSTKNGGKTSWARNLPLKECSPLPPDAWAAILNYERKNVRPHTVAPKQPAHLFGHMIHASFGLPAPSSREKTRRVAGLIRRLFPGSMETHLLETHLLKPLAPDAIAGPCTGLRHMRPHRYPKPPTNLTPKKIVPKFSASYASTVAPTHAGRDDSAHRIERELPIV